MARGVLRAAYHYERASTQQTWPPRTASHVKEGLHLRGHHAVARGNAKEVAVELLELVQAVKGEDRVVGLQLKGAAGTAGVLAACSVRFSLGGTGGLKDAPWAAPSCSSAPLATASPAPGTPGGRNGRGT